VADPDGPAIIILAASAAEETQARAARVATVLRQLLPINHVISSDKMTKPMPTHKEHHQHEPFQHWSCDLKEALKKRALLWPA